MGLPKVRKKLRVKRMDVGAVSLVQSGAEKNSPFLLVQNAPEEDEECPGCPSCDMATVCQEGIEAISEAVEPFEKMQEIDQLGTRLRAILAPLVQQDVAEELTEVRARMGGWDLWQAFQEALHEDGTSPEKVNELIAEFAVLLRDELTAPGDGDGDEPPSMDTETDTEGEYDMPEPVEQAMVKVDPGLDDVAKTTLATTKTGENAASDYADAAAKNVNVTTAEVSPPGAGTGHTPENCPTCGMPKTRGGDGTNESDPDGEEAAETPAEESTEEVADPQTAGNEALMRDPLQQEDAGDVNDAGDVTDSVEETEETEEVQEEADVLPAPRTPVTQAGTDSMWGSVFGSIAPTLVNQEEADVLPAPETPQEASTLASLVAQAVSSALDPLVKRIDALETKPTKATKATSRQVPAEPVVQSEVKKSVWQNSPFDALFER